MSVSRETMSPHERLWAAIRLEQPDRVPVVPLLTPEPAAHLAGMTMAQVSNNIQAAAKACVTVFDEYEGWDSMHGGPTLPIYLQAIGSHPLKIRIPGRDLPDDYMFQLVEEEVMKPEDYDKICEMGMDRFYDDDYLWRISYMSREEAKETMDDLVSIWPRFSMELKKRNIQPFILANDNHPFFKLSLMRSMVAFTQDLYYNPEPVERTLRRMTADLIPKQISIAKADPRKPVQVKY